MNVTEVPDVGGGGASAELEVQAVGTPQFHFVHFTGGLICMSSVCVSVLVLLWTALHDGCGGAGDFTKKKLFERMAVYLACHDILFSLSHGLDHLTIYVREAAPGRALCRLYAVVLCVSQNGAATLAMAVSAGAFGVVFLQQKYTFRTFDLYVLALTYLPSLLFVLPGLYYEWFGFNGWWCATDPRVDNYKDLEFVGYSFCIVLVAFIIAPIIYVAVTVRVVTVARRSGKTAFGRVNQFFVYMTILIVQWAPYGLYTLWPLFLPFNYPWLLVQLVVIFTNMGGLLNGAAFVLLRSLRMRRSAEVKRRAALSMGVTSTAAGK